MILVDANILIYAHVSTFSQHDAARNWLDEQLNGATNVGLPKDREPTLRVVPMPADASYSGDIFGEFTRGDIVARLGVEQPSISKHLRVLRDVGLVHVRRDGRQKLYRTNADAIRRYGVGAGASRLVSGSLRPQKE